MGMQTGAATMEHSMEFPQKSKNGTAFWPSNSTAEIIPEESWDTNTKELMHSYVHSSTIYRSQELEKPKCPSVNEWIKKLWYIYTMEFYAAERKKGLLPFVTACMELESIMLSEISQAVKDKYHMISPINGT